MLVIRPRGTTTTQGAGIFDVISKVANSTLARKVINSAVGKKVIEQVTKENLKKAANSTIGKQLQTAVVKSVADATEKAANATFKKIGISSPAGQPGAVARASEKAVKSGLQKLGLSSLSPALEKAALEQVFAATTLPTTAKGRKRKLPSSKPGRSKKKKRTGVGAGIILE